ncbi:hypothetical protein LP419_23310 [Massilia sp. H-1]|nr:hypothetical protein LP419_23310 [Massilia sp. H-1]
MSAIERGQLREFSIKYQGWRIYAAIARLILLFSVCGVGIHLLRPQKGLLPCILTANMLGLVVCMVFLVAYFNYRKMA